MRPFGRHDQQQARSMLAQSLRAVIAQRLVQRADGRGLIPAIELIVATPTVSELIRKGDTIDIPTLTAGGRPQKLVTLRDSLQRLVSSGAVSADEAERVANNEASLP
jgi:twitching motility protein PilT